MANNNNIPTINSAETLSLFFRPGEDKRLFNTNSDSIFTFGDFRIYRDNGNEPLTGTPQNLNFGGFSTMDSMNGANFNPPQSYSVNYNELTGPANDPFTYSYFGSFYTDVANSINNIIDNFPYAILSYRGTSGLTIYDYSTTYNNITGAKTATFKIPYSAITNQGNIIINSGSTISGVLNLVDNFTDFGIQMSANTTTATTKVIDILSYNFSAGTNSYLEFTINDYLEYISGPTSVLPIYIRPTKKRFADYKLAISKLENNILYGQKLLVPNIETDISESEQTFVWPTTIDGFAPDSFGNAFMAYQKSILKAAADIDDAKTNIMIKTMIPESYIEMDSSSGIYQNTIQTYAHEFDEIKSYIDGIAYAHSIQYNGEESVPNKFMFKLSNLLGWKLADSFSEIDLFEYLAGDSDGNGMSYSQFNIEIWKRILININWLYKKKGTRDALQFLFKLLGAPDCLVSLDEFVYKINKVSSNNVINTAMTIAPKINSHGYVDYDGSVFAFQEGGEGRGTGEKYINQWKPEFNPDKQVDNIKTVVYDPNVFGSEDTINSKELCVAYDPAAAIECDMFSFYQQTGTCWDWGSLWPPFSSNTVPFEYTVDCEVVRPDNITGMTFNQWMSYLYSNSIDPRNRKIIGRPLTSSNYPQLRNAYLNYYFWSAPPSNRLNFKKLESFLKIIERNFEGYFFQLIPATTILECHGTVIRNTMFNRQKFVYKEGLNDGSEFRVKLTNIEPVITPVILTPKINDYISTGITPIIIIGTYVPGIKLGLTPYTIKGTINIPYKNLIPGYVISGEVFTSAVVNIPMAPAPSVPAL